MNLFVRVDFMFQFLGYSPNLRGLLILQVSVYVYVCALHVYVLCMSCIFFKGFDSVYVYVLYMYVMCICFMPCIYMCPLYV